MKNKELEGRLQRIEADEMDRRVRVAKVLHKKGKKPTNSHKETMRRMIRSMKALQRERKRELQQRMFAPK